MAHRPHSRRIIHPNKALQNVYGTRFVHRTHTFFSRYFTHTLLKITLEIFAYFLTRFFSTIVDRLNFSQSM